MNKKKEEKKPIEKESAVEKNIKPEKIIKNINKANKSFIVI